jgi:FixJ family two-component response regulator
VSRQLLVSVIDDDASFRLALVGSLRSLGYGTRGFTSAEEFIAEGESGDCLVTDIHMPGMSGLDLLRRLKARGTGLPVIMVTGRSEPGLEAKAAAGGAVCLLMKPFKIDALISCLDRALKV